MRKPWRSKNKQKYPEKVRAHAILNNAIRRHGFIRATVCSLCGVKGKMQAHHDDYSKPLDVRWFCCLCHKKIEYDMKFASFARKEPTEMEITIIVNGQSRKVSNKKISYEEVVALAFNPVPPDVLFTVTNSMPAKMGGHLIPGKTVPVQDGMYFDAADTGRA